MGRGWLLRAAAAAAYFVVDSNASEGAAGCRGLVADACGEEHDAGAGLAGSFLSPTALSPRPATQPLAAFQRPSSAKAGTRARAL